MQIILSTAGISAQKNVLAIDVARASLIPVNISGGILSVAPGDNKKLVSPPLELILLVQVGRECLVYL